MCRRVIYNMCYLSVEMIWNKEKCSAFYVFVETMQYDKGLVITCTQLKVYHVDYHQKFNYYVCGKLVGKIGSKLFR